MYRSCDHFYKLQQCLLYCHLCVTNLINATSTISGSARRGHRYHNFLFLTKFSTVTSQHLPGKLLNAKYTENYIIIYRTVLATCFFFKMHRFQGKCIKLHNCWCTVEMCALVAASTGHRCLRSAARGDLMVPRTRTITYGSRSFAVSRPRVWIDLPPTCVHHPPHLESWTVPEQTKDNTISLGLRDVTWRFRGCLRR